MAEEEDSASFEAQIFSSSHAGKPFVLQAIDPKTKDDIVLEEVSVPRDQVET